MGRKQKLKQIKKKNQELALALASTIDVETVTTSVTADVCDHVFPKSHFYVLANKIMMDEADDIYDSDINKIKDILIRGAQEYGCVHSMNILGIFYDNPILNGKIIHLSQPWYLEGAILGDIICTSSLVEGIYMKAKPYPPKALILYWTQIEWNGDSDTTFEMKEYQDILNRKCEICSKTDTATLTLRQCMGCSTYCYCSEDCQTYHWERHNHRAECKQLKILNKYHKPQAKEIRNAAIRGETHPAVEKLRYKLGLSRPIKEYKELCDTTKNKYEGLPINPYEFLIARDDGTVWIGSTPINPMGRPSSDITSRSTTSMEEKGEVVGNMMKPSCDTIKDDDNLMLSFADVFRNNKVNILFERFDKDGDGFLNYDELSALQKATGIDDDDDDDASPLSKKTYAMVCQSLNCHPDTGLSVGGLKMSYASEDGDIDVDYDKVFHHNKTTVSIEDDQSPACLPLSTTGPCFGNSASSLGVLVSDFAAHKLSSNGTTCTTSQPQGTSLPFAFGGSTQIPSTKGLSGGNSGSSSDSDTLVAQPGDSTYDGTVPNIDNSSFSLGTNASSRKKTPGSRRIVKARRPR